MTPPDRRIQRTKLALNRALVELITHKGYDAITIQDLVDTANVGRSTFYSHYADKDDLLQEGIAQLGDFVRARLRAPSAPHVHPTLAFADPVFEHLEEVREMFSALLTSEGGAAVEACFRDMLGELVQETFSTCGPLPPGLVVTYVVDSFIAVARWWVLQAPDMPRDEIRGHYLSLVTPSLVALRSG